MKSNNSLIKSSASYVSSTSDLPLLGTTVGDLFDEVANKHIHSEALIVKHQDIRWTYGELKMQVDQCAKALIAAGITKGDRVGIWAPNCYEWTVVQFATAKVGAILVNINPSYRLHELEYALNQSGCKLLFSAHVSKHMNFTEMLYQLAPELTIARPGKLHAQKLPHLHAIVRLFPEPIKGIWAWHEFNEKGDLISDEELCNRQKKLNFDDPINIQYTSGTTGYPKAATLSHHNIVNNGYFVAKRMNFSNVDRLVMPVPLYHCFGMVLGNLGCVSHGATMIYPGPSFDAATVLQAIQEERATAIYGVPTMFIAELEQMENKGYDLTSLRTGIMAGAPCPIEVMRQIKTKMHCREMLIAYGMTETSPVVTQTEADTPLEKQVTTVGKVLPHVEIKLVNPSNGQVVKRGEEGEVCMRGYCVMLGYWNNREKTDEAIDPSRWIHSGDLGILDDHGYLSIVGRIKDMIIRGGENIYPREIEEFLFTHPKIIDAKIIGIPDEKYGEQVMAWIILRQGTTASEDEIKAYCKDQIAHFKIPQYIKFVDSFPLTVTGKVRKVEMREISIKEFDLAEVL